MPGLYRQGRIWYSNIYIGGKRVRKALAGDKRIAEEKLAELIRLRDGQRYGHAVVDASFASFKERVLERSKARYKRGTHNRYLRALRYVKVGSLAALTPQYLDGLIADWKTEGTGIYEINARLKTIKAVMRLAEAWGLVPARRWDVVHPIKTPRGRLLYYTPEEFKRLLSVCAGPWRTVAMLGAYAGLRRGEIASLRWEDVDFDRNRIHIAAHDDFTPKDYERRWIAMSGPLRGHLEGLRGRSGHVLGRSYDPGVLTTYMGRLIRQARLSGSVHTLRHTFASWLASAGVSLLTISKLLGHASARTTEIYAHLAPDAQEAAVNALPALK